MTQATTSMPVFDSKASRVGGTTSSLWFDAWRRLSKSAVNLICLAVIIFYLLVGLLGFLPVVERKISEKVGESFQPPHFVLNHPAVWFGTDIMGHSVFWQLVYGTRLALTVGIVSSLISMVIGTVLGVIAGYFGGWIDSLVIWLFSTFSSVPWILLVIAIAAVLQTHEELNKQFAGLPTVILALSLTSWIGLCRLIRGEVLKLRERDYVAAARAIGLSNFAILRRHIVPNVMHLIIIDFSLNIVNNVQGRGGAWRFLGWGLSKNQALGKDDR